VANSFARQGEGEARSTLRIVLEARNEQIAKRLRKRAQPTRPIQLKSFRLSRPGVLRAPANHPVEQNDNPKNLDLFPGSRRTTFRLALHSVVINPRRTHGSNSVAPHRCDPPSRQRSIGACSTNRMVTLHLAPNTSPSKLDGVGSPKTGPRHHKRSCRTQRLKVQTENQRLTDHDHDHDQNRGTERETLDTFRLRSGQHPSVCGPRSNRVCRSPTGLRRTEWRRTPGLNSAI